MRDIFYKRDAVQQIETLGIRINYWFCSFFEDLQRTVKKRSRTVFPRLKCASMYNAHSGF